MLESPEAKVTLLLRSLPESMNNIVDNLQIKEDLTYDHFYQRLLDVKSSSVVNSTDNKVYKSANVKGKGKGPGRKPPSKGNSGSKECTWCMKHYGGVGAKGHTWNECHKLKAKNENEKKKREGSASNTAKIGTEETPEPVSTLSSLRTSITNTFQPRWVIDAGASSHRASNLDLLMNFETEKGTVRLGDDSVIESCGCGTVKILAKTSDGHFSPVYLEHVLWVPSLGCCNLLSWRAMVSLGKGFSLVSSGPDMYVLRENKREVIGGKLDGQDYVVQEEKETARR